MYLIVTDPSENDVAVMEGKLTAIAVRGKVRSICQLETIGGILALPTPASNVSQDFEIVVFVSI